MDALIEHFFKTNELTGSEWEGMYEDDKKSVAKEKTLPVCDNDWDFPLLRQQLYDDNFVPERPYSGNDLQSDEEDSDEDSGSFSNGQQ